MADAGFANGGTRSSAAGASIECAEEGGMWRESFPLPIGRGVWGGSSAPSPEFFLTLDLKMSTSSAF